MVVGSGGAEGCRDGYNPAGRDVVRTCQGGKGAVRSRHRGGERAGGHRHHAWEGGRDEEGWGSYAAHPHARAAGHVPLHPAACLEGAYPWVGLAWGVAVVGASPPASASTVP